jgi:hypothetical protein
MTLFDHLNALTVQLGTVEREILAWHKSPSSGGRRSSSASALLLAGGLLLLWVCWKM